MVQHANTCWISHHSWQWDFLPKKMGHGEMLKEALKENLGLKKGSVGNALVQQSIYNISDGQLEAIAKPTRSKAVGYSVAHHGPVLYAADSINDLNRFMIQFKDKKILTYEYEELFAFYGEASSSALSFGAKDAEIFQSTKYNHQRHSLLGHLDISGTGKKIGGGRIGKLKFPKFRIGTAGQKFLDAEPQAIATNLLSKPLIKKVYFVIFTNSKSVRDATSEPYLVHQQTKLVQYPRPIKHYISLGKFWNEMVAWMDVPIGSPSSPSPSPSSPSPSKPPQSRKRGS